jgi:ABC-type Zn2+ transport system substrate-binding protein/surface adhesin
MRQSIRRLVPAWLAGGLLAWSAAPAAAELKVMVTIKPLPALVTQVMSGAGTPTH